MRVDPADLIKAQHSYFKTKQVDPVRVTYLFCFKIGMLSSKRKSEQCFNRHPGGKYTPSVCLNLSDVVWQQKNDSVQSWSTSGRPMM